MGPTTLPRILKFMKNVMQKISKTMKKVVTGLRRYEVLVQMTFTFYELPIILRNPSIVAKFQSVRIYSSSTSKQIVPK